MHIWEKTSSETGNNSYEQARGWELRFAVTYRSSNAGNLENYWFQTYYVENKSFSSVMNQPIPAWTPFDNCFLILIKRYRMNNLIQNGYIILNWRCIFWDVFPRLLWLFYFLCYLLHSSTFLCNTCWNLYFKFKNFLVLSLHENLLYNIKNLCN